MTLPPWVGMVGSMAAIQEYGWHTRGSEIHVVESHEVAMERAKAHAPAVVLFREHSMVTRPGGTPTKTTSTWVVIQQFHEDGSSSRMRTITPPNNRRARRAHARALRRAKRRD